MKRREEKMLRFLAGQNAPMTKAAVETSIGWRGSSLDKLAKDGLVDKHPSGLYSISAAGRETIDDVIRRDQGGTDRLA